MRKWNSTGDLYIIAQNIISKMPKPFVQVCGPIATGGLGSIEANLNTFNETIKNYKTKGIKYF